MSSRDLWRTSQNTPTTPGFGGLSGNFRGLSLAGTRFSRQIARAKVKLEVWVRKSLHNSNTSLLVWLWDAVEGGLDRDLSQSEKSQKSRIMIMILAVDEAAVIAVIVIEGGRGGGRELS